MAQIQGILKNRHLYVEWDHNGKWSLPWKFLRFVPDSGAPPPCPKTFRRLWRWYYEHYHWQKDAHIESKIFILQKKGCFKFLQTAHVWHSKLRPADDVKLLVIFHALLNTIFKNWRDASSPTKLWAIVQHHLLNWKIITAIGEICIIGPRPVQTWKMTTSSVLARWYYEHY